MKNDHWQYDPSFPFAHIQLDDFARVVNEALGNEVLTGTNLNSSFGLKRKPVRVVRRIPVPMNLEFLFQVLLTMVRCVPTPTRGRQRLTTLW
jgi:hypothetical protein